MVKTSVLILINSSELSSVQRVPKATSEDSVVVTVSSGGPGRLLSRADEPTDVVVVGGNFVVVSVAGRKFSSSQISVAEIVSAETWVPRSALS